MRHYLDHASTSPLRPEAKQAMAEALDLSGDPSRIHSDGMETRYAVETAREQVANLVGARPREIIFTSGATESIASVIWGTMAKKPGGHIVTSAIEHSAVLETSKRFPNTQVGVSAEGLVDATEIAEAITSDTALLSIQHVNHEIGATQEIEPLIELGKEQGLLVHVDAAQSVGHMPFHFKKSGADLVSVSAHKFGGPPGIGALLVRQGLRIDPFLKGGSQERARRAGMENVTAIVGFGATAEALTDEKMAEETENIKGLTEYMIESCSKLPGISVYGAGPHRAPHILCFGFEDIEPQAIVLELDRKGISVHSGSACSSEDLQPSSVLMALGVDAERSLRVSPGHNSTRADAEAFVEGLTSALEYLKSLMASY